MGETIAPFQGLDPVVFRERWVKTHRCTITPRWGYVQRPLGVLPDGVAGDGEAVGGVVRGRVGRGLVFGDR